MSGYVLVGNYVDPDGVPVIATQVPDPDDRTNRIGGIALATGWCCRWLQAVCEDVAAVCAHGLHGLKWDHGRTRHVADPGDWIVWDGAAFLVVKPDTFETTYAAVPLTIDGSNS